MKIILLSAIVISLMVFTGCALQDFNRENTNQAENNKTECNELSEEECKNNSDCAPIYAPSFCDETSGLCTDDLVYEECRNK